MLEMEMRWYNLAKRLKATDDKIKLIREGKLNTDSMTRENACCVQRSESKPGNAAGWDMMFSGMETFNGTESFIGTGPEANPNGRGTPPERA